MICLYSAVSLTPAREWRFIRIYLLMYWFIDLLLILLFLLLLLTIGFFFFSLTIGFFFLLLHVTRNQEHRLKASFSCAQYLTLTEAELLAWRNYTPIQWDWENVQTTVAHVFHGLSGSLWTLQIIAWLDELLLAVWATGEWVDSLGMGEEEGGN